MELSFEYYDWIKKLNEAPQMLIFISLFGSIIFLIVFGIIRYILKGIGLGIIADWKFLDDFMICFFITGFFGGFLLLLFSVIIPMSNDGMSGIRFLLIWIALFMCVMTCYLTNKVALKKWFDELSVSTKKTKRKPSYKRKKRMK